jgi:hypothetical protein
MHWHNFQVSILVRITYNRNPEYDILDSNSLPFLKEVHYYVSNDTHHDSLFVQHAFMLHWEFLQTIRFSQANTWCGVMVAQGSSKV